jgi:hypothetical protein
MRKLYLLCASISFSAGLLLAENYTGRLVDASCQAQNQTNKPCDATGSTTAFLLESNGKLYKLDAGGNSKAAEAIKSRADRSAGGAQSSAAMVAKISGAIDGEVLRVEQIEIQ